MKKCWLLCLLLTDYATSEDPKRKSEWADLDEAESVNCAYWPIQKQDLALNELITAGEPVAEGLVASMRMRNSSVGFYYAPFGGKVKLDPAEFRKLDFGRGALPIGGIRMHGKLLIAVVQHRQSRSVLELRSVETNAVLSTVEPLPGPVVSGAIFPVEGGFWLSLKHHEQSSSIGFVGLDSAFAAKPIWYAGLKLEFNPTILPIHKSADAIAVLFNAVAAGRGRKDVFSIVKVSRNGSFSDPKALTVKIDAEVESYSAIGFNGHYYLAYIDGDSMVGQAKIRTAKFSWADSPVIIGEDSRSLGDAHVSEPLWLLSENSIFVGILKWVDEESTFATYKLAQSKITGSKSSGVFAKGSRIIDRFQSKNGQNFLVVRARDNEIWRYRLCQLKGLHH